MSGTTHLYLIRHGEAFSNIEHVLAGESDRGLTERGTAQARALGARLANGEITADVLYASTFLRARQTAEFVSEALKLPINWDDELQELRPGEADGMHIDEARTRFENLPRFLQEPFTPIAPGGESWATFQYRVSAALENLITRHRGQTIVAVAHGGVIEVSFLHFLGLGPQARQRAKFYGRNTAITHWSYGESFGGRWEWHMVSHNDYRPLVDLDL
jgi:probable phosphoglycerate mutase